MLHSLQVNSTSGRINENVIKCMCLNWKIMRHISDLRKKNRIEIHTFPVNIETWLQSFIYCQHLIISFYRLFQITISPCLYKVILLCIRMKFLNQYKNKLIEHLLCISQIIEFDSIQ